jgi:hypothetical protein
MTLANATRNWMVAHFQPANIRNDLGTNSRSTRFGHRRSEGCKKNAHDVGNVDRSYRGADHIDNRRL